METAIFFISIICAITVVVSVAILIIVTRKLSNAINLGKELAETIKTSTLNLEHVRESVLEQYEQMCEESAKLDARLIETGKIKKNINNLIVHMQESHNHIKKSYSEMSALKLTISTDLSNLKEEIKTKPAYNKEAFSSILSKDTKLKTPYAPPCPIGVPNPSLKPFPKITKPPIFKKPLEKPEKE